LPALLWEGRALHPRERGAPPTPARPTCDVACDTNPSRRRRAAPPEGHPAPRGVAPPMWASRLGLLFLYSEYDHSIITTTRSRKGRGGRPAAVKRRGSQGLRVPAQRTMGAADGGDGEGGPVRSGLEQAREDAIRRNSGMLRALGLPKQAAVIPRQRPFRGGAAAAARKNGRASVPVPSREPTRRSARTAGRDAPNYADGGEASWAEKRGSGRAGRDAGAGVGADAGAETETDAEAEGGGSSRGAKRARLPLRGEATADLGWGGSESLPPDSSRNTDAAPERLLEGTEYLGRPVAATKAEAMGLLCRRWGQRVRFSKYAGMVEWRNAVVTLFVNAVTEEARAEGADETYANRFYVDPGSKKVRLVWFAARNVTAYSPGVLRLLRVAGLPSPPYEDDDERGDAAGEGTPAPADGRVVLYCRVPGCPYIFCGEVSGVSVDFASHPLKFVWELDHTEACDAAGERDWTDIRRMADQTRPE